MPNWVFNRLEITGNEMAIKKIKETLGADNELTRYHFEINEARERESAVERGGERVERNYEIPVLDFHNLLSPPKEIWNEYVAVAGWGEGIPPMTDNNWYRWRNQHWGTKWNAGDVEWEETETCLIYKFQTAWDTISEELLQQLAYLLSAWKAEAELEFEEETGWGGKYVTAKMLDADDNYFLFFNLADEYAEPDCHAAYELRDRECMCVLYESDPEMWFGDCPPAIEATLNAELGGE